MSSRCYIVKQDLLSTGQPDAIDLASPGTQQSGTRPVDGLLQ